MKLTASRTLGLMVLAALASPYAMADETAGWYVGGNVGQTRATIDDERILRNLGAGATIEDDDRSTGFKLFGGYQINKNFAVEGGYFDLGDFGYEATVPGGTLTGNAKVRGLNIDLVGILPITEKFSAFGRVGVTHAQTRDSFRGTGAVLVTNPNPSERDTNVKYGLGLQYAFTDHLSMRGEVERYRINDAVGNKGDIDMISLGLVYKFDGRTQAPRPQAAYVAAAPVSPVVTPPPAAPAPRKVSFAADSLFDFDQETVKPAGKQELDQFAGNLKGADYDVITVTGHTDRLGSEAYNMKLSTRRAETVKNYLVESAGIPTGKIAARGAGESDPVTKPGECKGEKASKQLITCLQADRRVEVEVAGTK